MDPTRRFALAGVSYATHLQRNHSHQTHSACPRCAPIPTLSGSLDDWNASRGCALENNDPYADEIRHVVYGDRIALLDYGGILHVE